MEITVMGIITFVAIIYALIKRKDTLLYLTIFSTVFIACATINIKGVFGVSPFHLCGLALIIQSIYLLLKNRREILNRDKIKDILKENKIIIGFIIYGLVIVASIVVLYFLKLNITYQNNVGTENYIKFGTENIKAMLHIGYIFIVAIIISLRLNTKEKCKKALNSFIFGVFLSLVYGLIQYAIYVFNFEYPYWLFNNSVSFAQLYKDVVKGIKRINSFGAEVSFYSPIVIAYIAVVVGSILEDFKNGICNKWKVALLILGLVICFFTTSSTAYIALTILAIIIFNYIMFSKNYVKVLTQKIKIIGNFIIIIAISLLFVLVIYNAGKFINNRIMNNKDNLENPDKQIENNIQDNDIDEEITEEEHNNHEDSSIIKMIADITINKLKSQSAEERRTQDEIGLRLLKENNIITGLGQGNFRSLDMLTNILCNTGMLGLLAYFYLLLIVYKEMNKLKHTNTVLFITLFSLVTSVSVAFWVSIPDLIFAFYWIILVITYKYAHYKSLKSKTKLGIDLTYIRENSMTGIRKHGEEILEGINRKNDKYEIVLFIDKDLSEEYKNRYVNCKKIEIKTLFKKIRYVRAINYRTFNKLHIKSVINAEDCDIILHPYTDGLTNIVGKKEEIITIHDIIPLDIIEDKESILYNKIKSSYVKMMNSCMNIITISNYSKNRLMEINPKYKGEITVIPNAVSKIEPSGKSAKEILNIKEPYIFTLNSFFAHKNQITLVKAFNIIKDQIPHKLVLIGRPELTSPITAYNDVIKYIEDNNLNDRVIVKDKIMGEDRSAVFYNTDIFISTSMQEGFGRTPVEAAMCRVPVISTRETSLPEATMEKVFYYEHAKDENELAEKILYVLNNRPTNDELEKIAQLLEKEYDENRIAQMYIDLIDKILEGEKNAQN